MIETLFLSIMALDGTLAFLKFAGALALSEVLRKSGAAAPHSKNASAE
jgi:hypothetical protein